MSLRTQSQRVIDELDRLVDSGRTTPTDLAPIRTLLCFIRDEPEDPA